MTATVAPAPRDQISKLISSLNAGNLSPQEVEIFNRFVAASSMVWAGQCDGELLCVWGLIPPTLLSDQAYLWLHTTDAVEGHEFVFVRRSQIEIKKMLEEYPRIVGHCLAGADRSIRWLKWLGAKFEDPMGRMVPFVIERTG